MRGSYTRRPKCICVPERNAQEEVEPDPLGRGQCAGEPVL